MTLPEVMLWQRLRGGRIGAKVRKQHPIGPYIVDFYVPQSRLVIEVDGVAHDLGNRPQRDVARDCVLARKGYQVLRVSAVDVLKDIESVVEGIVVRVQNPLHHPSDGPPPRPGEDP